MNSLKVQQMRCQKLSVIQKDVVIGSLLGDGYLLPTTYGYSFRVHHGVKQKVYLNWKYSILQNIVNTKPRRDSSKTYYFRTISHPEFNRYREMFYDGRRHKKIPKELHRILNSRSLAVWIMDDGSNDRGCARINSQSFSYLDNMVLCNILKDKFAIEATIHRDKNMFRLWIRARSMDRLREIILPYTIPSMLYKLSP